MHLYDLESDCNLDCSLLIEILVDPYTNIIEEIYEIYCIVNIVLFREYL